MVASVETKAAECETHGQFESRALKFNGRQMPWSMCPVCADIAHAKHEAEKSAYETQRAQERLENRIRQAGIPHRYRAKDFASYIADTDGKDKARSVAMEFANNFDHHRDEGTVVVFSGKPGTGKSHLAISIAQSLIKSNTVLYTSAIDAVRMIRNTWRKNSEQSETEVLEMLASIDLLILDEVGVQYGTEAEQVSLFDIIDKRYRDLMPTILLTNQGKAGLKAFLGERSFDRLREGGMWVAFDWASQRGAVPA